MVQLRTGVRKAALTSAGAGSIAAAFALQFAPLEAFAIDRATVPELLGVLGLLVLPPVALATLALSSR